MAANSCCSRSIGAQSGTLGSCGRRCAVSSPNRLFWLLTARFVRRLRMAHQRLDGAEGLGAVLVQRVEGARLDQALDQPLVQHALVEPLGEVEQVLERAVLLALLGQPRHGLAADALDGGQRVADRLLALGRRLDGELGRSSAVTSGGSSSTPIFSRSRR